MKSPITFWRIGRGRWNASEEVPRGAGPEFDDERRARVHDDFAGFHAARVLIHLDDRLVAHDLDDLSQELLFPDELDVVHPRAEPRRGDDGSGDPKDLPGPLSCDPLVRLLHRHSSCSML